MFLVLETSIPLTQPPEGYGRGVDDSYQDPDRHLPQELCCWQTCISCKKSVALIIKSTEVQTLGSL